MPITSASHIRIDTVSDIFDLDNVQREQIRSGGLLYNGKIFKLKDNTFTRDKNNKSETWMNKTDSYKYGRDDAELLTAIWKNHEVFDSGSVDSKGMKMLARELNTFPKILLPDGIYDQRVCIVFSLVGKKLMEGTINLEGEDCMNLKNMHAEFIKGKRDISEEAAIVILEKLSKITGCTVDEGELEKHMVWMNEIRVAEPRVDLFDHAYFYRKLAKS
ncbi:hypothetical protein [Paraburkholderia sediminicola]|uniref:hypothetical protein n=1 Tax=Paraburkholderia sediminicola TaxID=458836 RepID=UPI0038B7482D